MAPESLYGNIVHAHVPWRIPRQGESENVTEDYFVGEDTVLTGAN